MRTNLQTDDLYGKMILKYIEENASDVLVAKINSGSKTMDQCMSFIMSEAKKQAKNGMAMVEDSVVYGWAVHFFEEDSIVAEEHKPKTDSIQRAVVTKPVEKSKKVEKPKDECTSNQVSIFDFMGTME